MQCIIFKTFLSVFVSQESPVIMTATEVESSYSLPQQMQQQQQQHAMQHVVSSEVYTDDQQPRVYYAR